MFDGHQFVFLSFVALRSDKSFATFHLAIAVGMVELHFQGGQALFVLFVLEEGSGCQNLEADIVAEEFVLLEERVNFPEVSIPEVAFSQKVEGGDMGVTESDELVCEEYGIWVVVYVEVIHCEFVEPTERFVAEDQ